MNNKKIKSLTILKIVIVLVFLSVLPLSIYAQKKQELHCFDIQSPADLKEFFSYTPDRIPLVCAHRGAARIGFPENSIATLENTLSKIHAFFEIDPRLTKDSVIVAFHDERMERLSTGVGNLSNYTWAQLQDIRLKDPAGNITDYKIHKLEEILQWAKGKTILVLDKKNVPSEKLLRLIEENKAESHVLISSFRLKDALFYYRRNPNLMFEAIIKDEEVMQAYENSQIPLKNIVGFNRQPLDESLIKKFREKGMMSMTSTAKFDDKEGSRGARSAGYKRLIRKGIDVILTDRALEVYKEVQEFAPEKSSKSRFFVKKSF